MTQVNRGKALSPEQKRERVIAKANEEKGTAEPKIEGALPVIRKAPERVQRTARGVFNGTRGKLKISEQDQKNFAEAGWHLHIFNDQDGRIESALSIGYEFVTRDEIGGVVANVVDGNTDLGGKVKFRVGQSNDGNGLFAYLMKCPISVFLEEQASLQKKNDATDAAIRAGKNVKPGDTTEGLYDAGIKY